MNFIHIEFAFNYARGYFSIFRDVNPIFSRRPRVNFGIEFELSSNQIYYCEIFNQVLKINFNRSGSRIMNPSPYVIYTCDLIWSLSYYPPGPFDGCETLDCYGHANELYAPIPPSNFKMPIMAR